MKRTKTTRSAALRCLAVLGFSMLAGACAHAPVRQSAGPAVFFPPAPNLPRIQYLTSFAGRKDIETQSSFDRFVVGEKADLRVNKPYGIAVHEGRVYVCDTNSTVAVFDFKRKTFSGLKGAYGQGALSQPVNISVDRDGNKYVSDPVRGQVVVFDEKDEFLRAIGTQGEWFPVDAVPFEDRLYVADGKGGQVVVHDLKTGEKVKTIGNTGEPAERLQRPTNLAFDRHGSLYVTDFARFQVVKYDRDGHFKAAIGNPGNNLGHFARPKGIDVDRAGNLYAVDAAFNNIQIFNPEGRLLMFFGEGGDSPGGFILPAKVTVDYENVKYFKQYLAPNFEAEYLIFVTSQFGERRVNVLAYGHEKGKKYPTDAELRAQLEARRKKALERSQVRAPEPAGQQAAEQPAGTN